MTLFSLAFKTWSGIPFTLYCLPSKVSHARYDSLIVRFKDDPETNDPATIKMLMHVEDVAGFISSRWRSLEVGISLWGLTKLLPLIWTHVSGLPLFKKTWVWYKDSCRSMHVPQTIYHHNANLHCDRAQQPLIQWYQWPHHELPASWFEWPSRG